MKPGRWKPVLRAAVAATPVVVDMAAPVEVVAEEATAVVAVVAVAVAEAAAVVAMVVSAALTVPARAVAVVAAAAGAVVAATEQQVAQNEKALREPFLMVSAPSAAFSAHVLARACRTARWAPSA